MNEIEFPDYINTMPSFYWWELDEFIVMVIIMVIGYLMGSVYPLVGLVGGIFIASRLKKWKRGEMDGAIPQIMFRRGLVSVNRMYRNANHPTLWV